MPPPHRTCLTSLTPWLPPVLCPLMWCFLLQPLASRDSKPGAGEPRCQKCLQVTPNEVLLLVLLRCCWCLSASVS